MVNINKKLLSKIKLTKNFIVLIIFLSLVPLYANARDWKNCQHNTHYSYDYDSLLKIDKSGKNQKLISFVVMDQRTFIYAKYEVDCGNNLYRYATILPNETMIEPMHDWDKFYGQESPIADVCRGAATKFNWDI